MAKLPKPADAVAAAQGIEAWTARVANSNNETGGGVPAFAAQMVRDPAGRALLSAIFGNSSFLGQAVLLEPALLRAAATEGLAVSFDRLIDRLIDPALPAEPRPQVLSTLRIARRQAALLIALGDLSGAWPLERVTAALSGFADAAINAALAHLLRRAAAAGQLAPLDPDHPLHECGVAVIGMGKLGARELNYSSDVDLIVLFDPERLPAAATLDVGKEMQRITRQLVTLLSDRTRDGYVLRVDLRLRPDPGSTPLAISIGAAEAYYESLGQNWERAAMIKARPVAGDLEVGHDFITRLRPFVWRKNLDFAAIQDIHSIKRQINAHKGHHVVALHGHDIKVGRGGIREIEFYAQTQQLIWGGRLPEVRVAATCPALRALATAGRTERAAAETLISAYAFLRRLEHRLQMVADEQRHNLPSDDAGFARIATFMGYADPAGFGDDLKGHLERVEQHYAELFEDAPALGSGEGNLVFTGTEDDPDTLRTLASLGFREPAPIAACIRGWHHGRIRATRSTRAREILTELMPALLKALGATANPDAAFMKFNEFLSNLPSGVQLFSLFYSNPELLDQVADVMGSAPRLAEQLSRRPSLLEGVLTGDYDTPLPGRDAMIGELEQLLRNVQDFQDTLDAVRRFVHDRQFQVGVQLLRSRVDGDTATANLSDLADTALLVLLPRVEAEFRRAHGRVPGGGFAVIALGKLGSRELTFESDLDLVFVYDTPRGLDAVSDGERPLAASQYYARLGQRLVGALTALTPEGRLFEVDTRLRPSGNAGPFSSEIGAFLRYHMESAWTFEHMALTRARLLAAPRALARRLEDGIRAVLSRERDPDRLVIDVAEMRHRIDAERHTDNPWRLKYCRGGQLDLEFIAQYLQLREASRHPEVLALSAAGAFGRLAAAHIIRAGEAQALEGIAHFYRVLQVLLRLTVGTARDELSFPPGVEEVLTRSTGMSDFGAVKRRLFDAEAYVRACFERNIERPAAEARQRLDAAERQNRESSG
ncbi:MAG: bifunctional [glutamine synthetase] adenylyltransferase/[glutamine synthetase]-adenylyl-L-tyrosine phosphorylase [Alphaproteobacteria bacterium]